MFLVQEKNSKVTYTNDIRDLYDILLGIVSEDKAAALTVAAGNFRWGDSIVTDKVTVKCFNETI